MGYERNDRRYGYDRDYRGETRGNRDPRYDNSADRGFFDRAGDEVRSWFGDEEAERRRRADEMYDERYDREHGRAEGGRYADYAPGGYRSPDRYPNWNRSNRDDGPRASGYARGYAPTSYHHPATGEDRQFETGYPDSLRTRSYADTGYRYDSDRNTRSDEYRAAYGGTGGGHRDQDVHGYGDWRNRQISQFDRDYDEYRREHQSRFENEFASWRQDRQTQRDSLTSVAEHMEVVGSDGAHVGKVDHVRDDRILLAKSDPDAGGHHHSIPSSWIQTVDTKVHISKSAAEAQKVWRDEDANKGLFERGRDDRGDDDRGTINLNRSFSGTY
jgi:hypothetical protein